MLNTSGHDRVAMVVRVVPWFVSPIEFSGAGLKPGSLSLEEWQSLPEGVHPLLRHLVADLPDQIQRGFLRHKVRVALAICAV